jgi:phytoene synthase
MILGACPKNKHTLPLMQIKPRTNPVHSAAALPKHVTIARHMNPENYVQ